jgi:ribosomal protein S18 acetylase RimI-like enzyme
VSILIREITPDDIDGLTRLLVEANDLHAAALPHVFQRVEADEGTTDFLRNLMAEDTTYLFVAEDADQLVGYVAFRLLDAPSTPLHIPRRWVAIDTVVVGAAFRRQGIGAALVRRVHEWAVAQGIDQVKLGVAAFNAAAIAFYEKLGYTTVWNRMGRSLADGSPTQGWPEHGR